MQTLAIKIFYNFCTTIKGTNYSTMLVNFHRFNFADVFAVQHVPDLVDAIVTDAASST